MGNGQGVPVADEEYTHEAHEQRLAQARKAGQGLQQNASLAKGQGEGQQGQSSLPSIANRQKGNYELNHPSAYAHGLATLDELMGTNRDAVKYKNELDAKTHYLTKKLQEQANEMERLLYQMPDKSAQAKQQAALHGPPASRQKVVDAAALKPKPLMRGTGTGGAPGAMKDRRRARTSDTGGEAPRQRSPGARATLRPETSPYAMPTNLGGGGPERSGGSRRFSLAAQYARASNGSPLKGTLPASGPLAIPPAAQTGQTSFLGSGPAALRAKSVKRRRASFSQTPEWRKKVNRAKRKLYWFLKAYMGFISVLKRSRKAGDYADELPPEVMPAHLANVLGDMLDAYGEYASTMWYSAHKDEGGAILLAKAVGHKWADYAQRRLAGRRHSVDTSEVSGTGEGDESAGGAGGEGGGALRAITPPERPRPAPALSDSAASPDTGGGELLGNGNSPQGQASSRQPGSGQQDQLQPLKRSSLPAPSPPRTAQPSKPQWMPGGQQAKFLKARFGNAAARRQNGLIASHAAGDRHRAAATGMMGMGMMGSQPANDMFRLKSGMFPINNPYLAATMQQMRSGPSVLRKGSEARKMLSMLHNLRVAAAKQHYRTEAQDAEAQLEEIGENALHNCIMIANNANARFAESIRWSTPPIIHSVPALTQANDKGDKSADMKMYSDLGAQMFEKGEIAVMLIYGGEDQVVGYDNGGNELLETAITLDLWQAISRLYPHKMPKNSTRIQGVPWLARRILQVICEIDNAAGEAAVQRLRLLLAIDAPCVQSVVDMITGYAHFGLRPEQLIVMSIARVPGMRYIEGIFRPILNMDEDYSSAGSGYALLSLCWPSCAFAVTDDGERHYLPGSVLSWLQRHKVPHLHVSLVCDTEALLGGAPITDPFFLAPALYCFDTHNAGIALEVTVNETEREARAHGNLVVAPDPGRPFVTALHMNDLCTPKMGALLLQASRKGTIASCPHRMLLSVKVLAGLLKRGPQAFNPDVRVHNHLSYLSYEWSDLTNWAEARCVAVHVHNAAGPDVRNGRISTEFLRDHAPAALLKQDNQPGFRDWVMKALQMAGMAAAPVKQVRADAERKGPPYVMMMLVADNAASKAAFRVAKALMRYSNDRLILVHILPQGQHDRYLGAKDLLDKFSDPMYDSRIERRIVTSGDRLLNAIVAEVDKEHPDLVVVGSMVLSDEESVAAAAAAAKQGAGGGGHAGLVNAKATGGIMTKAAAAAIDSGSTSSLGSVAFALAKLIVDVPLCIVKTTCRGGLLMSEDVQGGRPPINAVLDLSAAFAPVMEWAIDRLEPSKDMLHLAKTYAMDRSAMKSVNTQAIIRRATDMAVIAKFEPRVHSLEQGPTQELPGLVASSRADILVVQAPTARVLPVTHAELLRATRSAVLLYRTRPPQF